MVKIKKTLFLLLYYALASRLPNYSSPGGSFYNAFRVFCLRQIMPVGHHCRIMRNVYVGKGTKIEIGNYCRVNEGVRLDNIKIGDHVMIARETVILGKSHEHEATDVPMERQGVRQMRQGIIENDVWIGLRVSVLPGLHIGQGTIVGANALLTRNTEPYSVYGGVPAKFIKRRATTFSK